MFFKKKEFFLLIFLILLQSCAGGRIGNFLESSFNDLEERSHDEDSKKNLTSKKNVEKEKDENKDKNYEKIIKHNYIPINERVRDIIVSKNKETIVLFLETSSSLLILRKI